MRSPSGPSCGFFGTGAPARCACASPAKLATHSAVRKRQTDFHGRKTGLPPPPMICPRAADLRQRNTHNALRLTRSCLTLMTRPAHTAFLSSTVCPHRAVERLRFSLDGDVCGLVWRDEGAVKAFSPKLGT